MKRKFKKILKKIYEFAYYDHPWIYEVLIIFIIFLILFAIALILAEVIKYLFGEVGTIILIICIIVFAFAL